MISEANKETKVKTVSMNESDRVVISLTKEIFDRNLRLKVFELRDKQGKWINYT